MLIDGASGGVGTFAIQIAKSFATEVTAVCSTTKLDIALSIGADYVIDYTQEDFSKNGLRYDLIFVANGNHSVFQYKHSLTPNGNCVMAGGEGSLSGLFKDMLLGLWISKTSDNKIIPFVANINQGDLFFLKQLVEAGKIKPVIDRRYQLSDVPDAIRYLEEGHAKGKVIITV
ncbi:MAG: NAD(P)-dependent alcohol dehydrogenase [Ignavibacteriaceae bacterium]|nr:NAD(P)-dependent alcohol dehydrogenase [Ignavibacteriaceae bacterium]